MAKQPATEPKCQELAQTPVVALGASAGGIEAFQQFLQAMPADSGLAFVLVLHLDPTRESPIAGILGRQTPMPVREIEDGMALEPNYVYVIAPNRYVVLEGDRLRLQEPPVPRGQRKPVDALFRSLAEERRHRAIGVILSGTGANGSMGLRAIKGRGGLVIAQEPATAGYDGMPRSAIDTGLVDLVLPVEQMPQAIQNYASHPYMERDDTEQEPVPDRLDAILAMLRTRQDFDFRCYKQGTLSRRIQRRMSLNRITSSKAYLDYLRSHPAELEALARDLMINVTHFFRDPAAWQFLSDQVLDDLCRQQPHQKALRAWVAGCATGEEAYTLAMLLVEKIQSLQRNPLVQIFASDLSRDALSWARNGLYPDSIAGDLTPARLSRFFRQEEAYYRIGKELRDQVTFSLHNLISDPPFGHLDLITCRNLLIYLEPEVQEKVLGLFHFALRPGGYLFLGTAETVGSQPDLFEEVSRRHRIYRRIGPTRLDRASFSVSRRQPLQALEPEPVTTLPLTSPPRLAGIAQQLVLERYTRACVLVNRSLEILYFFGPTHDYLRQPVGERTADLLAWAPEGLRTRLRGAIHEAISSGRTITVRVLAPQDPQKGQDRREVDCTVESLQAPREAMGLLLVAFQTRPCLHPPQPDTPLAGRDGDGDGDGALISQLEYELQNTRDELRSVNEQLESANEEFRATNEEVMSINEELQSANEELETSKEELQSLNEELVTSNQQLETKNIELEAANDDLNNLLVSTDIATLFLDRQFSIRRFTPAMTRLLRLIASDIGRSVEDITCCFDRNLLLEQAARVLERLSPAETEIRTQDGHWYLCRVLPYRTEDNRIGGVMATFTETTARHQAEARQQFLMEMGDALVGQGEPDTILAAASRLTGRHFAVDRCGYAIMDPLQHQVTVRRDYCDAEHAYRGNYSLTPWPPTLVRELRRGRALVVEDAREAAWRTELAGVRLITDHDRGLLIQPVVRDGQLLALLVLGQGEPRPWQSDEVELAAQVAERVWLAVDKARTDQALQQQARQLAQAHRLKDEFLAMLGHELRNPLAPIRNTLDALLTRDDMPDQVTDSLQVIDRQTRQLQRLVDDLLDVARINQGRIKLERRAVELGQVAREAVEGQQGHIRTRRQTLALELPDGPLWVEGDRVRLVQVVGNLLHNATNYTPEGGHITLSLTAAEDRVELRVSDDGQGIEPEQVERIFELFARDGAQPSRGEGLGVGLAVVQRLVEMHDGRVGCHSPGRDQGSTFTVTLPRREPPAATPAPAQTTQRISRRVLVVDDNPDVAAALNLLLKVLGHQPRTVNSGREALAMVGDFQPEVALVDLGMPEMDGFQVAQALRQQYSPERLRLVALTGYGSPSDLDKARQAGFDWHLLKPADRDRLADLLSGLDWPKL